MLNPVMWCSIYDEPLDEIVLGSWNATKTSGTCMSTATSASIHSSTSQPSGAKQGAFLTPKIGA